MVSGRLGPTHHDGDPIPSTSLLRALARMALSACVIMPKSPDGRMSSTSRGVEGFPTRQAAELLVMCCGISMRPGSRARTEQRQNTIRCVHYILSFRVHCVISSTLGESNPWRSIEHSCSPTNKRLRLQNSTPRIGEEVLINWHLAEHHRMTAGIPRPRHLLRMLRGSLPRIRSHVLASYSCSLSSEQEKSFIDTI